VTYGRRRLGAAFWALTVWATGRLGAGTNGRRRFGAGRFGARRYRDFGRHCDAVYSYVDA